MMEGSSDQEQTYDKRRLYDNRSRCLRGPGPHIRFDHREAGALRPALSRQRLLQPSHIAVGQQARVLVHGPSLRPRAGRRPPARDSARMERGQRVQRPHMAERRAAAQRYAMLVRPDARHVQRLIPHALRLDGRARDVDRNRHVHLTRGSAPGRGPAGGSAALFRTGEGCAAVARMAGAGSRAARQDRNVERSPRARQENTY